MKKNGYTIGELLVLMAIVGIATIIFLTKTSYAFKDNSEEYYENMLSLALKDAKDYGATSETLKNEGVEYITIGELVQKGYILIDKNGSVEDPRNKEKTLDDVTIKLKLNENQDIIATIEK